MHLTVIRIKSTLTVCSCLGDRQTDKGYKHANAKMLKGGWYENKASDLTLFHEGQRYVSRSTHITYPSIVEIANWYIYSSEACELIREKVSDRIEINIVTCGPVGVRCIALNYALSGSPKEYWIVRQMQPV